MSEGIVAAREEAKVCGGWKSEDSPLGIEYSWAVMEEMAEQSREGVCALGHGGLEVGGVLYGVRADNRVRVTACAALACEHARGPGFLLSENDMAEMAKMPAPPGLQTLGWYSSRTRRSLEMDDDDRALFGRLFPWSGAIAILIDPETDGRARAAFYFRDHKGDLRSAPGCDRMSIDDGGASGGSGPESEATPMASAPDPALELEPEPEPELEPATELEPEIARLARPGDSRAVAGWQWMAVAAAVAVVIALTVAAAGLRLAAPPQFGLRAYAIGPGQMRIEWDRGARPIRGASSGVLEIDDGPSHLRVPLSAEQLRLSSITYLHRSANVSVRLGLDPSKGKPGGQESLAFQGQPAAVEPAQRPAPSAAATPERPLRIPELPRVPDAERAVVVEVKPPPKPFQIGPATPAVAKVVALPAPPGERPAALAVAVPPLGAVPLPRPGVLPVTAPASGSAGPSIATSMSSVQAGRTPSVPSAAPSSAQAGRMVPAPVLPAAPVQTGLAAFAPSTAPSATQTGHTTPAAVPAQAGQIALTTPVPAQAGQNLAAPAGRTPPATASNIAASSGPRSGRLIWTGSLSRRGVLEIEGGRASVGSLAGALPGRPVGLHVSPAELGPGGLVVYTSDAMANLRREAPSASNGWNATRFEWDPERASRLAILEAPNPSNDFSRLVVRNDARNCSVIVIDWSVP